MTASCCYQTPPRVITRTAFDRDKHEHATPAAGAPGFPLKDVTPERPAAAVQLVRAGGAVPTRRPPAARYSGAPRQPSGAALRRAGPRGRPCAAPPGRVSGRGTAEARVIYADISAGYGIRLAPLRCKVFFCGKEKRPDTYFIYLGPKVYLYFGGVPWGARHARPRRSSGSRARVMLGHAAAARWRRRADQ